MIESIHQVIVNFIRVDLAATLCCPASVEGFEDSFGCVVLNDFKFRGEHVSDIFGEI
jgi:hypothetical protein